MNVVVGDYHTDIYIEYDEVVELCKPGMGKDTCLCLLVGNVGFQCAYFHKSILPAHLLRKDGNAQRDGCNFVKNISPGDFGHGEHELEIK